MTNIHNILLTIVIEYLHFYDKHTLQKINKYTNCIQITDLYNIKNIFLEKLDDNILKQYKSAIKLNVTDNQKITNINHMRKIKILNASGDCGINNESIKLINPEILIAHGNTKITNINHMTNLRELYARNTCGIDNNCIKNINLEILDIQNNQKNNSYYTYDKFKRPQCKWIM